MKGKATTLVLVFVSLVMVPALCSAFDTISNDAGQELTVYGFLRNNTGMFNKTQEYAASGNQLATERNWLRLNVDAKLSEKFRFWGVGQVVYEPQYGSEMGVKANAANWRNWRNYSEYGNINDVMREAYFEWKPKSGNSIKMGRQIAIWGEALTDRVNDIVHPNDNRFSFAFANLEDTRIPQYMIRGIHEIASLKSSIEWIISPPLVGSEYTVNRNAAFAQPLAGTFISQRLGIHPEDRNDPSLPGYPFIPTADVNERYPDQLQNTHYGFRTSTLALGSQFGFSYYHTNLNEPIPSYTEITRIFGLPAGIIDLNHPAMDVLGFYANKQLPWPGVVRTEVAYIPNKPYNTFDVGPGEDGIVRRDTFKYLIAYDLSGFLYFDWHKTAPFDITVEHIGEWVPNSSDLQYAIYNTKYPNYQAQFNLRISTNWYYNRLSTDLVVGYGTFGNSGLFMPAVKYTPGWWNQKFSAELKYIGIYGQSNYEGVGIFKQKSMTVLTTQLNF